MGGAGEDGGGTRINLINLGPAFHIFHLWQLLVLWNTVFEDESQRGSRWNQRAFTPLPWSWASWNKLTGRLVYIFSGHFYWEGLLQLDC